MTDSFKILEYIKGLFNSQNSILTKIILIAGIFRFIYWFVTDYLAYLIIWIFETIQSHMTALSADINLNQAGLNWAMVNSWVPVPEIINYLIAYFNLFLAVMVVRWVRNIVPGLS